MPAKTVMIQGTASNVGKSIVTTALCRLLKRRGLRVAPFKAQNMANNSFITVEGGEIGRAQAVQAMACGVDPSQCMNPILLKPNSDRTSQVVVMGKDTGTLSAKEYQSHKRLLTDCVDEALFQLRESYDVVVIEGAGSPAEINMKQHDIVNMHVARRVSSPVILVADIDKGGVFAQIVGTFELLDRQEQSLVKTFLINKFRGDKDILTPGVQWLEERLQRPSLGVLPMIPRLNIAEEDSVALDEGGRTVNRLARFFADQRSEPNQTLLIQVIRLPRISNFTDFDALAKEPDVVVQYIDCPDRHIVPDILIIPGTKSTIDDLRFLKSTGLAEYVHRCARVGVCIVGICGGYQMLGQKIYDPLGVESRGTAEDGLGLLPMETIFQAAKTTQRVKAIHTGSQTAVEGYEIHMGQTKQLNGHTPMFRIVERQGRTVDETDGVMMTGMSGAGDVCGTYIHGLFDAHAFRRDFLNRRRLAIGLNALEDAQDLSARGSLEQAFDRLADEFGRHVDMKVLSDVIGEPLL